MWVHLVNVGSSVGWVELARLEQQYRHLPHVKVDKMLGLVCDVRAKVPAHNAVPSRVELLVKLLLDVGCNVLFYVELFHGLQYRRRDSARCRVQGRKTSRRHLSYQLGRTCRLPEWPRPRRPAACPQTCQRSSPPPSCQSLLPGKAGRE